MFDNLIPVKINSYTALNQLIVRFMATRQLGILFSGITAIVNFGVKIE